MMIKVPPFDALEGRTEPTGCFGDVLGGAAHERALSHFTEVRDQADNAVQDIFGWHLLQSGRIVELDEIIREMWDTGWDPETGNLKLFVLHFGALLTAGMLAIEGTAPVFRSERILDHVSVWHVASQMEYFAVH